MISKPRNSDSTPSGGRKSIAHVGDFDIAERRTDFGSDDARRKSLSSYEVLGQTYFLIRDRVEKKKVYLTGAEVNTESNPHRSPVMERGSKPLHRYSSFFTAEEPTQRPSGAADIETRKATIIAGGQGIDFDNFDRNGRSGILIEEQNTLQYLRSTLRKTVEFGGETIIVRNRTISGNY